MNHPTIMPVPSRTTPVRWGIEIWQGKRSGLTMYSRHGYNAWGKCVQSTVLLGDARSAYLLSIQTAAIAA